MMMKILTELCHIYELTFSSNDMRIKNSISHRLFFFFIFGFMVTANASIDKNIMIRTVPSGALVSEVAGPSKILGSTPLKYKASFRSEKSIIRLKIMACGRQDTIIRVSPDMETVTINLDKKRVVILPETKQDVLNSTEEKQLVTLIDRVLNRLCQNNPGLPANYMDIVMFKRENKRFIVRIALDAESREVPITRRTPRDTLLQHYWEQWFTAMWSGMEPSLHINNSQVDFLISVLVGKKTLSIKHVPGVNVKDKLRVKVSSYETPTHRVTVTRSYYETVTEARFDTRLIQTRRSYEMLYNYGWDTGKRRHNLAGSALLYLSGNKLKTLFDSGRRIDGQSFLKRVGY